MLKMKNEKNSCTVFAWKWQLILVTSLPKMTKSKKRKMKWTRHKTNKHESISWSILAQNVTLKRLRYLHNKKDPILTDICFSWTANDMTTTLFRAHRVSNQQWSFLSTEHIHMYYIFLTEVLDHYCNGLPAELPRR